MRRRNRVKKQQIQQPPPIDPPKGLSTGAIVGIVFAVLALIGIIVGVSVALIPASGGSNSNTPTSPTTTVTTTSPGGTTTSPGTSTGTGTAPTTTSGPSSDVKLFLVETSAGGNFGSRSVTDLACAAAATNQGLTCPGGSLALLSYVATPIQELISLYGIDGNRALRLASNNAPLAANLYSALGNRLPGTVSPGVTYPFTSPLLGQSLDSAGLRTQSNQLVGNFATGFSPVPGSGNPPDNCNDWTSVSGIDFGDTGRSQDTSDWLGYNGQGCNNIRHYLCLCL